MEPLEICPTSGGQFIPGAIHPGDHPHHAYGRALRRPRCADAPQPLGRTSAQLGEFGKTALFVTHLIEESIYRADRILVMTYRTGTIYRDQRIDLP